MPEEINDPFMALYERLVKLIEEDPVAYFAERARLLDEAISACPAHIRPALRRMQDEVDFIRTEKQNPAHSCAAIFGMIGERLEVIAAQFKEVQKIADSMRDET